ncbi:MAG: amidase [Pseudomonadales bacterium]|nr:amidase [Pseudomonadales bacterium]
MHQRINIAHKLLLLLLIASPLWLTAPAQSQTTIEVFETDISQLQAALEAGTTTSVALVEQYLARIEAYDQQGPVLNSILRLNPEARAIATALDAERQRTGARSQLHGIPIVVKDNYNTAFMPTTGASVALAGFTPNANATQIEKLLAAGAIILAKTNLHEYAYGITSISSLQGQTRNPYDLRRVPGGSSGGTAAAVAASFAAIGLGSDTCGSIRIPAAFNNLIGLRPTKGLSSIHGLMPLAHTQDVAGPLARSAEDLAILLDVVVGYDPNDAATELMRSAPLPGFQATLGTPRLSQLRLGKLTRYLAAADAPIRQQIEQALAWYEQQGAEIIEVDIPELGSLIARSGVIAHEFRADLEQYLAQFESANITSLEDIVGPGLYHQAVQGVLTRSLAAPPDIDGYAAALAAREDLRTAIEQVLQQQQLDALIYPPIAQLQVFLGENQPGNNCSLSANSGLPALSLPVGFTAGGLPVGMELLGSLLSDASLLAIGHAYEQGNASRQPPSTTPALRAGVAPPARVSTVDFSQSGIDVQGTLSMDVTTNLLSFRLTANTDEDSALHAVTLIIDTNNTPGLNEPVALHLLGPQRDSASGEHFMSPALRTALAERRVHLRVFGSSLPLRGVTYQLP